MICAVIAGSSLGAGTYDGVYTGKRMRTEGPAELCPNGEDVCATIDGRTLRFTDSTLQKFALAFDPDKNGSFSQTYNVVGVTNIVINGHVTATDMDVDVTNGSTKCKHHWHLTKNR
jgi:hypothetical protein